MKARTKTTPPLFFEDFMDLSTSTPAIPNVSLQADKTLSGSSESLRALGSGQTPRMREVYDRLGIAKSKVLWSTYSDSELIEKWFLRQIPMPTAKRGSIPLWEKLCDTFAVMEGSARTICARHDYDPDMPVRKK